MYRYDPRVRNREPQYEGVVGGGADEVQWRQAGQWYPDLRYGGAETPTEVNGTRRKGMWFKELKKILRRPGFTSRYRHLGIEQHGSSCIRTKRHHFQ